MTKAASAWQPRVRAWQTSGASLAEFARSEGLAVSTLRYWVERFAHEAAPQFVRLVPAAPPAVAPAEVVVEVGGARVRVGPGFDAALLTAVVRVLGASAR